MKLIAKSTDTKSTTRFISEFQKDDDPKDQIVWNVRDSLNHRERKLIRKLLREDVIEAQYYVVHIVLDSIENFFYEDGTEVKLEREKTPVYGFLRKIKDDIMDVIPDVIVDEINVLVLENFMSLEDEDVKNS